MRGVRRVAVLIDREQRVEGDPELLSKEALEHAPAESHLAAALRRMKHEVSVIAFQTGDQLIADLQRLQPDVVFNATEHVGGCRADDLLIPALLEMLRIPYTGSPAAALLLCRDKAVSKSLAAMVGVRAPSFALAPPGELAPLNVPPFPVVVKPVASDSSDGIDMTSVVRRREALAGTLERFHRRHRQTAIVESFIPGSDVYVFVLQGRGLKIMPPVQLCIDTDPSSPRSMATYHVKHNDAYREKWNIHCRPAKVRAGTQREIERGIRRLWPVLQLRDYARFDFRMSPAGEIYFIEANPNPAFSPRGRYDPWPYEEYEAAVRLLIANAARRGAGA
jgi:D-alanine-D-alanine ligase